MKISIGLIVLFFLIQTGGLFALVNGDGLTIKKRFDHGGGTDGYYLGDIAAFGSARYKLFYKVGYSSFVGSYGSFTMIDWDSGSLIYNMDKSLKYYGATLETPASMAVKSDGTVYVGDIKRNEIQLLRNNGSELTYIKTVVFKKPVDLYYNNSVLYAVNAEESRVACYDQDLIPLQSNGKDVSIITKYSPVAVCAFGWSIVVLTKNRVLQYLSDGSLRSEYAIDDAIEPVDIEADSFGSHYILDKNGPIHKYRDGVYVCTFLTTGTGDYQLSSPTGLYMDRNFGEISAVDSVGLKSFQMSAAVFDMDTEGNVYSGLTSGVNTFKFKNAIDSQLTVEIWDSQNKLVKTLLYNESKASGIVRVDWNGKDITGSFVPAGSYSLYVKSELQYSSFNTAEKLFPFDVKDSPSLRITSSFPNILKKGSDVQITRFNTSEEMEVLSSVIKGAQTNIISLEPVNGPGWFYYNYQAAPLDEGGYQAFVSSTLSGGRLLYDSADFYINYYPLILTAAPSTTVFSPKLGALIIPFSLSEDSSFEMTLNGQTLLTQCAFLKGGHSVSWDGCQANRQVYPDGLYTLKVKAFQADVDSAETNLIFAIDSTPPVITTTGGDNRYASPVDSPGVQDNISLHIKVNEQSEVFARVLDLQMGEIRTIFADTVTSDTTKSLVWDGKDSSGLVQPDGHYLLEIRAKDKAGNETVRNESIYIDNNRAVEDFRLTAQVTLLREMAGNENHFQYLSKTRRMSWIQEFYYYEPPHLTPMITNNFIVADNSGNNTYRYYTNKAGARFSPLILYYSSPDERNSIYYTYQYAIPTMDFINLGNETFSKIYLGQEMSRYYNNLNIPHQYMQTNSPLSNKIIWCYRSTAAGNEGNFINWFDTATLALSNIFIRKDMDIINPPRLSPDYKYLVAQYTDADYVLRMSDRKLSTNLPSIDFIEWIDNQSFYGYKDGKVLKVNLDPVSTVDLYSVTAKPICFSPDRQTILLSDSTNLLLFNTSTQSEYHVFSFDSLVPNDENKAAWFTDDGNSLIAFGIKNGKRGIYKIDLGWSTPQNLTAVIQYPNPQLDSVSGMVQVRGTASDTYFDSYHLSYQRAGVSGWTSCRTASSPVSQSMLGSIDTTGFSEGGNLIIKLSSFDKAGNIREYFTTNKVVNTGAYLLSSVSADRYFTGISGAVLQYKLNDTATIFIKIKDTAGKEKAVLSPVSQIGQKSFVLSDSFLQDMTEGKINFTVFAVKAGKTNSQGGELYYDRTPPAVLLNSSLNTLISDDRLDLVGFVGDAAFDFIQVSVNGQTIPVEQAIKTNMPGQTIASIYLPEEGNYSITVLALDKCGNTNTQTGTIIVDRTAPVCRLDTPAEGQTVRGFLSLAGAFSDSHFAKYEVYLNNIKKAESASSLMQGQTIDITGFEGMLDLKIIGYDSAGNVSSTKRQLIVDNQPPVTFLTIGGKAFSEAVFRLNGVNYIGPGIALEINSDNIDSVSQVQSTYYKMDQSAYLNCGSLPFSILAGSGPHELSFYSVDSSGNVETPTTVRFIVDDKSPSVGCFVNEPQIVENTVTYVPMNNRIQFNGQDADSGLANIRYSFDEGRSYKIYNANSPYQQGISLENPGLNSVQFFAVDNTGNSSPTNRLEVFFDPVPPSTLLKMTGLTYKKLDTIYFKGNLTVNYSVSDYGVGTTGTYLSTSSGNPYLWNQPVEVVNGTNILEFYSVDRLNNEELRQKYALISDSEPPISAISMVGKAFTNGSIFVHVSNTYNIRVEDKLSGILSTFLSINGTQIDYKNANFYITNDLASLELHSVDNLSNIEQPHRVLLEVDRNPPQSAIVQVSGQSIMADNVIYCQSGSKFSVRSIDSQSGLQTIQALLNGQMSDPASIVITNDGTFVLNYFASDYVGNIEVTNRVLIVSPIPDHTLPIIEVSGEGITVTNQGVIYGGNGYYLTVHCSDPARIGETVSGISKITVTVNSNSTVYTNDTVRLDLSSVENNISITAIDNAGNESVTTSLNVIVDKEAPVTVWTNQISKWVGRPVLIALESQDRPIDASCGVANTFIDTESGYIGTNLLWVSEEGVITFSFYSVDNLQNQEQIQSNQVMIDLTPPIIDVSGVEHGYVYGGQTIQPVLEFSDKSSGLSNITIQIWRDGVLLNTIETNTAGLKYLDITNRDCQSNGSYSLNAEASDTAGNHSQLSIIFTIDGNSPEVPQILRHLYNGRQVFLEWNTVTNLDLLGYILQKDTNQTIFLTNTTFIDIEEDEQIHTYRVRSIDYAWNKSEWSSNENVFASDALQFVHPSTNEYPYFTKKIWLSAALDRPKTGTKKKDALRDFIREHQYKKSQKGRLDWEDFSFNQDEWSDELTDLFQYWRIVNKERNVVQFEYAVSNSFVPVYFNKISSKAEREHKKYSNEKLDLRNLADGPYVLRVSSTNNRGLLEDAVWFGVDNTEPYTYLVAGGRVLNPFRIQRNDEKLTVKISRTEATNILLRAVDPLVNGSASGVGNVYYALSGNSAKRYWNQYRNETISLKPGKYTIYLQSVDNATYFWEQYAVPNIENIQKIELIVEEGNGVQDLPVMSATAVPVIVSLYGIAENSLFTNSVWVQYNVQNAERVFIQINDRLEQLETHLGSLQIEKPGHYEFKVIGVDKTGEITIKQVFFKTVGQ